MNVLEEVQAFVAAKLSSSWQLSSTPFLVENRKDLEYEIRNRLGKQGLVGVVMTPKAQFAGKYEDLFLAWQLDELEVDVIENPPVNRGKPGGFTTGQDAAMRVFDVLCPLSGDAEGQFCPVSYEEGEDSGLIVNRCVMKALVYGETQDAPSADAPIGMKFVKLLEEPPSAQPRDGWMWMDQDGTWKICKGEEVLDLGCGFSDVSSWAEGEFYPRSETSSASELSAALSAKQDALSQDQLFGVDQARKSAQTKVRYQLFLQKTLDIQGQATSADFDGLNSISKVEFGTGVTSIGRYALDSQPSLTAVDIPETVTVISSYGLARNGLSSVSLPQSLQRIGGYAFYKTPLSSIELPAGVRTLGEGVFSGCSSLADAKLNDGLDYISSYVFRNCRALTRLEIPRSVSYIGYGAFMECYGLSAVVFRDRTLEEIRQMDQYPWAIGESRLSVFQGAHEATTEWTEGMLSGKADASSVQALAQQVSQKAEASAMVYKRDLLDFKVYEDPLADVSATVFSVTVHYAGSPDYPLFSIQLTHSGGELPHWTWSSGSQDCGITYYDGQYVLVYHGFQDGGGAPHSGTVELPLSAPYWTCRAGDSNFEFGVTSYKTEIATREWVLQQLSALQARLQLYEGA